MEESIKYVNENHKSQKKNYSDTDNNQADYNYIRTDRYTKVKWNEKYVKSCIM